MPSYSAVCCYFGQWPSFFQLWLQSCSYNTEVIFFLVTDISVNGLDVPGNVKVVHRSFADVQELVQRKFPEIQVSLDRPYKLCDFKPAYGFIFADLFEGYDYWGFYDIDTIWGDITKFIPNNGDAHLIKIFPCGHLSFIRNQAPYDKAYELVNAVAGTPCRNNMQGKNVKTWQDCFSSSASCFFDEEGGLEPLLSANDSIAAKSYVQVDFDNILPPWRFDHFYSINFPQKSHNLVYSFEQGHLFRHYLEGLKHKVEEISYLHISKRQMNVSVSNHEKFVIYPNQFCEWRIWNTINMLIHGRKRYFHNLCGRIVKKQSFQ